MVTNSFQSTPAHERATEFFIVTQNGGTVSIHARSRAGDVNGSQPGRRHEFQSTPAHERATATACSRPLAICFNPRPLTSGRRHIPMYHHHLFAFQSTPAHERATLPRPASSNPLLVSIHARSRAGDSASEVPCLSAPVSIHARSRAGDTGRRGLVHSPTCFNPRPLTSGRPCQAWAMMSTPMVSIHARSRAGDHAFQMKAPLQKCFNPRPLTSGRPASPPRRRRPHLVSIHARSRAGDAPSIRIFRRQFSFNPRPLTSGRRRKMCLGPRAVGFNPRPLTSGRLEDCRSRCVRL